MTAAFYAFIISQVALCPGSGRRGTGACGTTTTRGLLELVAAGLIKCGYFPYPLASPSNKVTPPGPIAVVDHSED